MRLEKLLLIVLLATYSSLVVAQESNEIRGKIIHQGGNVISGAKVQIKDTNDTTYTDSGGLYSLHTSLSGNHELEVFYADIKVKQVKVVIGKNTVVNITLSDDDLYREKSYNLDAVVVTGKSTLAKVKEKAFNVSVVEAKKLHNTTMDLGHSLDKVSGIRVRESGGVGSGMSLSMNGFQGKQVKFFIDGVPMENFGSAFQINNIPISMAKRIEVYKGVVPISLGSDALGGAVNIISNMYDKSHLDVSYSYGSFNTHRTAINAVYASKSGFVIQGSVYQNYSDNNYKIQVDVADIKTGKYYPNQTVERFHDKYHNEIFIGRIGVVNKSFADQLFIGLTFGKTYRDIQNGARIVSVFGDWYRTGNIIMPNFLYKKDNWLIDRLNFKLNANINLGEAQNIDVAHRRYNWFGQHKEYSGPGGERRHSLYKYKNNNGSIVANWDYTPNTRHQFSLNNTVSFFKRRGHDELDPESKKYDSPQKATKNIMGIGYQFSKENWNISVFGKNYFQKSKYKVVYSLSSKWDEKDNKQFGHQYNYFGYGFAYSHFLTKDFQIKTSFEKTYRLPENEEIFGDLVNLEGNLLLRPETSNNLNLGFTYWLNWFSNKTSLTVNGFYRDAKDFIRPKLNRNQTMLIMDNLGRVTGTGIEMDLLYEYRDIFSIGVNLTYQNLINEVEYINGVLSSVYKDRIPNIPYLYGNFDLNYQLPTLLSINDLKVNVGYNILYVHQFYLYWSSLGSKNSKFIIPRQISNDFNLRFNYRKRWQFTFECRNIFNSKIYDNFSLQKPGRSFSGKIKYQFF